MIVFSIALELWFIPRLWVFFHFIGICISGYNWKIISKFCRISEYYFSLKLNQQLTWKIVNWLFRDIFCKATLNVTAYVINSRDKCCRKKSAQMCWSCICWINIVDVGGWKMRTNGDERISDFFIHICKVSKVLLFSLYLMRNWNFWAFISILSSLVWRRVSFFHIFFRQWTTFVTMTHFTHHFTI